MLDWPLIAFIWHTINFEIISLAYYIVPAFLEGWTQGFQALSVTLLTAFGIWWFLPWITSGWSTNLAYRWNRPIGERLSEKDLEWEMDKKVDWKSALIAPPACCQFLWSFFMCSR